MYSYPDCGVKMNIFNILTNAKEEPKVFYAKHITPGVCAYENETILIGEETLKEMDKTFAGKPVYVGHQKVNLDNLQQEADGYVSESFYLPEDGSHWLKFIAVSDKAQEAIKKGYKVSNGYIPEGRGVGGEWHNVPYQWEVTSGKYTHLALVDDPRYEEAVIMTPEEFKKYKETKKAQLEQLQNSKTKQGVNKMQWKLFAKKEVTNSDDISNVMVELSNGRAVSVREMVNALEEDKAKEDLMACKVKVNGEDMAIADLISAYEKKDCRNEADEEEVKKEEVVEEKKEEEKPVEENPEEKEAKKNEDVDKRAIIDEVAGFLKDKGLSDEDIRFVIGKMEKDAYEKDEAGKDNEDKEEEKPAEEEVKKEEEKGNSKSLLEAEEKANAKEFQGQVVDTMSRKIARGAERYGAK